MKATAEMRFKTFPARERLVLIPVELVGALKAALVIAPVLLILSGLLGPAGFWPNVLNQRLFAVQALLTAILAGAVLTPLLLPWFPGLGLASRVHFLGLLTGPDLLQAYRDADLLTLLSHRENFGMAAVEAMAAGLPVLLTKEVGLAEEITQAQAGHSVSAQPDQIAEVWVQMLNAPKVRHEMGLRGKAIVRQIIRIIDVASQMLKLFADSVGGH